MPTVVVNRVSERKRRGFVGRSRHCGIFQEAIKTESDPSSAVLMRGHVCCAQRIGGKVHGVMYNAWRYLYQGASKYTFALGTLTYHSCRMFLIENTPRHRTRSLLHRPKPKSPQTSVRVRRTSIDERSQDSFGPADIGGCPVWWR